MTTAAPAKPAISTFERYLSVWVALCIVVGIAFGYALPGLFGAIASAEVAGQPRGRVAHLADDHTDAAQD